MVIFLYCSCYYYYYYYAAGIYYSVLVLSLRSHCLEFS